VTLRTADTVQKGYLYNSTFEGWLRHEAAKIDCPDPKNCETVFEPEQ
jgi:hypothetical protein